jgi:multiple sugar transport system permease protein
MAGTDNSGELRRGPIERWAASAISNPERTYRAMFYVVMVFFLVTTLFPFYWLLMLALSERTYGVGLVPNGFQPSVFIEVFQQAPFQVYMFNSFVLATATTIIVLLLASLAGYVFGRLEFPGKYPLMLLILAISYFPPAAFFLPLWDLFNGKVIPGLVLYNNAGSMVMPFSALFMPLSIFILTTFYGQIPDGLEDAARIEGTTRLGALFRVIIPLSAPGVATAGVLTFIAVYNEFFFSFLMNDGSVSQSIAGVLSSNNHWAPIVKGILGYQSQFQTPFDVMAAASIIGVLPVAILVVIAQEKIVSGLTAGALKE